MANVDVFGLSKTVHGADKVVSGSGVMVSIGGMINLAQQADVNYQRQIQAIYELGTENVYAGMGGASGTCTITRMVGAGIPALKTFQPAGACKGETIFLQNGQATCGDQFGTLKMQNSMLQTLGVSAQAGSMSITETATYWVGSVEAS